VCGLLVGASAQGVKGGLLQPAHLDVLVDVLFRHDAILHACAIDVAREDPQGVDAHKVKQCEGITKYLAPTHHPNFVRQVWELRHTLERMPNQLYIQFVLMNELVCSSCEESTMYFSQRRPHELAKFEWTIDAKDSCRITPQEQWWHDTLAPFVESSSRREPMILVKDAGFDYRFFDRSVSMQKEMWHPDAPREVVDGYDIKKMMTEHMAFVDSRSEILIQAVDILASFLRRLLAGELAAKHVAQSLGKLQIRRKRGNNLLSVRLLTLSRPPSDPRNSSDLSRVLQQMSRAARNMIRTKSRLLA
jgi:hypothetical protein